MTWTCQEGSGSLLGKFIRRDVAVRLVDFGFIWRDSPSTGEPHYRRQPGLCPFLDLGLANEVAREDALGSASQFGLLQGSIATDQFGTAGGIERFERAGLPRSWRAESGPFRSGQAAFVDGSGALEMRRGCRGFQDMPLPDWHAAAVHRARSSALPPRVCAFWSARDRR